MSLTDIHNEKKNKTKQNKTKKTKQNKNKKTTTTTTTTKTQYVKWPIVIIHISTQINHLQASKEGSKFTM